MTTRIAVIDDEVFVRKGVTSSIDWKRYDIEVVGEAANGQQGLELIRRSHPHIVLTDIKMPQMDGLEMARIVRSEFPEIKILFMSVLTDFETVREAIRLNAADYVQKFLVQPENLLEIVLEIKKSLPQEAHTEEAPPQEKVLPSLESCAASFRPEVRQAMNYVKQHYAEPLRVQDVSAEVGLSENYFSFMFSNETGTTFSQYVQEFRIAQARTLLEEGKTKWYEVSTRVGFDDPKYFTKVFKRYTTLTPTQYYRKYAGIHPIIEFSPKS
ncbi:response regulator transcription factor [Paenibacillus nasutitermitis]|uniref:DNA-binding response regulator n=1 Tax=Paenibacillus nasutitermitis TaxID=1652958 RepID=A0A916YQ62_9BACL|nr:response regulator [Paenibacillus nasutitermitis]GGD56091.1 DNA-binding response regulator [Paenibacillus nasutitermitis]